ncbi:DNA replication protein psf2 [Chytriomyces hyalinus]|nr:DNA replication protein psf2 [Chytriomyces hyalinus]
MALPPNLRQSLSPQEIEFLAENQQITIVPTRAIPNTVELLSGDYGPFRPPLKSKVPLWLALTLKKRGKCSIVPPLWLDPEYLELKLEQERGAPDEFSDLPFTWFETATILMRHAQDDIPHFETISSLIKSIKECRSNKCIAVLKGIDLQVYSEHGFIEMHQLGFAEVNEVKPFFTRALEEMGRFSGLLTKD